MTLISAFRSPIGIALCADTQETVAYHDEHGNPYDLRKAVQKLTPIIIGGFQVAIAGSGNPTLIESFIELTKRRLRHENLPNPGIADASRIIEDELALFYRNDVAVCPDNDKNIKLFIGASCPSRREFNVWVTEGIRLRELASDRPEIVGWEHEMYNETARRFYTPHMRLSQAVLAAIYTLTVAKQTSNYVGGDLHVAVVRENGIWMEEQDYVDSMEARLGAYDNILNQLFLYCADTEISPRNFDIVLEQFKTEAQKLHRQQLDVEISKLQAPGGGIIMSVNPLARIPPGTLITVGRDGKISSADFDPPHDIPVRQGGSEDDKAWEASEMAKFQSMLRGRQVVYIGEEQMIVKGRRADA